MDKCNKKSYYIVTEVTHNIFIIYSNKHIAPFFIMLYTAGGDVLLHRTSPHIFIAYIYIK